jgi:peptidoglycan lytic transglycosylase
MSRQRHDFKHLSVPVRPPRPMAGLALSGLTAALVAACSTAPVHTGGSAAPPVERVDNPPPAPGPAAATPPRKSYAVTRGGAFYKDDGPGDSPPENLAEVPDAVPRVEPLHRFANRPYAVFGQDYVPAAALAPYREQGMASWYGRKFHGLHTSSGEPYDMYGMTAAHPTLPIPSYARVTNLANGSSVVVRINDRGPFHKGRVIDLSYTAAFKLGYVDQGSTQVEVVSILGDELPLVAAARRVPALPNRARPAAAKAPAAVPPLAAAATPAEPVAEPATLQRPEEPMALAALVPPPAAAAVAPAKPAASLAGVSASAAQPTASAAAPGKGAFLQLGAFTTLANAEGFRNHVKEELAWLGARLELLAENGRYRLHAGPYASAEEAQSTAARIAAALKLKPFLVWR